MATTKTKKKVVKKDFATQTIDALQAELVTVKSDLNDAKKSHAARELVSTARITELRRNIARIKTQLSVKAKEETK